jgi:hypothetical protein
MHNNEEQEVAVLDLDFGGDRACKVMPRWEKLIDYAREICWENDGNIMK